MTTDPTDSTCVVYVDDDSSVYISPDLPGDREAEYRDDPALDEARHALVDALTEAVIAAQAAGVADWMIESDFNAVMSVLPGGAQ